MLWDKAQRNGFGPRYILLRDNPGVEPIRPPQHAEAADLTRVVELRPARIGFQAHLAKVLLVSWARLLAIYCLPKIIAETRTKDWYDCLNHVIIENLSARATFLL